MSASAVDVVVVGAGPTGLTAALELTWAGIKCRIVDQAQVRSDKSRALAVQARTLELLARHGIAQTLVKRGRTSHRIGLFVQKRLAADVEFHDIGIKDTAFPFILFVSQVETERVLEARLLELGVKVERPVTATALEQDESGVTVTLGREGEREEQVRARYVIGADGAHSVVRKAAGLSFEGAAYPQDFMLADVDVSWDLPHDRVQFFLGEDVVMTAIPLKGDHHRFIAVRPQRPPEADPTLEEMQELLQGLCPVPVRLTNPKWLTRFHLHHRGVNQYRQGRLFVAGDAAHIHSPAGGQGMNAGIQDAVNLAWKLAYVLLGRAGEHLLDSYHEERFPVGRRLLSRTDRFYSVAASSNSLLVAARNYLAPRVVPLALKSPATRAQVFRFVSQLGVRYRSSPVVSESCMDMDDLLRSGPRAGDRVPDCHFSTMDGKATSLQRELHRPNHTLLLFAHEEPTQGVRMALDRAREFNSWIAPVVVCQKPLPLDPEARCWVDTEGEIHARLGIRHAAHVLIRPDGHVAYRAQGLALEGVPLFLKRAYGTG
jgi:2-polyprenyl-6-methoxyphenol hydroxylase-like FAD-dependent oxidoreductase